MRLPLTPPLDTRDGVSAKNARLTNCLKETTKRGDKAVIRPGLVINDTYTGLGNGLIPFDGRLLVIYDDTVYDTGLDDSMPWPLDSLPWDAGTTYSVGDSIWCSGVLKYSMTNGNIGNACNAAGTTYWAYAHDLSTYVPSESYDIGDTVVVEGVTYYSLANSNIGNEPASKPNLWSTSTPPSTRYYCTGNGYDGIPHTGASCATKNAALEMWYSLIVYRSCATKSPIYYLWLTSDYQIVGSYGQFMSATDRTPYNCSNTQLVGYVDAALIHQTA